MTPGPLHSELSGWLDEVADDLDRRAHRAPELLQRLCQGGAAAVGIPEAQGGTGGDVVDAVNVVAAVSEHSLAAGFVLWGHRTYIEYLLQSSNTALREAFLPDLLAGRVAGATGLSNAMKFLAGLEDLQVAAEPAGTSLRLNGRLPWVTNLRPQGFHVAAAVSQAGGPPLIVSLAHDDDGLVRSPDLELMALRGTNTAAISVGDVIVSPDRVIAPDATAWLPQVRPAFLGLQCGMSIGLARRALREATACLGAGRHVLAEPASALAGALVQHERDLVEGLRSGVFKSKPAALFHIRIGLADIVAQAVSLELHATGGRAYLVGGGDGFARRWREAAFVPVITPSLVQLKSVLEAQRRSAA